MPEGAVEFRDEATRTFYEHQEDGELTMQSTRQAQVLCALARMELPALDDVRIPLRSSEVSAP